jgi:hypothetical protein
MISAEKIKMYGWTRVSRYLSHTVISATLIKMKATPDFGTKYQKLIMLYD